MQDSREKIEADVREWAKTRLLGDGVAETVIGWLDRQDAITQRDCIDRWDAKLQGQVDKLKQELAERNGAVCERDGRLNACERRNTELKDALKAISGRYGVDAKWYPIWSPDDIVRNVSEGIEQTHMRLPLDADGVPVHIGDTMERVCAEEQDVFTVGLIGANGHCMDDETRFFIARECRHVKPDTVESLLEELFGIANLPSEDELRSRQEIVADYAERIRKVVEHG